MKRVAFRTFGCRLNQYDTETIRTLLEAEGGYRTVTASESPEVFVVNTCSVTARADATSRKAIRRIRAEHPDARIVVTGCYAQRAPDELAAIPGVSLVAGAADRARLPALLSASAAGKAVVAVSPIEEARTFLDVPITEMMEHSRAFVKVQEGCDESCSFCIVPQTRGRSRSREPERVVEQVAALAAAGYREIVVTGVHLGDYGLDLPGGRRGLVDLVRRIFEVPGVERFRLSSIEPASVTDDLVELAADEPRFARHFHLPFQSGSDEILARMRRRYRADDFTRLVERIADAIPECGIGTDVICGFPGESDDHFRETFDRLAALPITYVHAFTYSVRPGSEAEGFGDHVGPEVKKRRTRSLKRLGQDKNAAFRERQIGRTLDVLLEPPRRAGGREAAGGWTDNYLRVSVAGADAAGEIRPVRITGLAADGLAGALAA